MHATQNYTPLYYKYATKYYFSEHIYSLETGGEPSPSRATVAHATTAHAKHGRKFENSAHHPNNRVPNYSNYPKW